MVYILLADGFEEMEALIPADLLRRAGASVALVGLEYPAITGGHGITVTADLLLHQVRLTGEDLLLLPGGLAGVNHLSASAAVRELILSAHKLGCWLAAICAAPTILGKLGLLEGKKAVCYPGMEAQLTGATIDTEAEVVVDGRIITSRAAGTAYEFAFTLIRVLFDQTKSEEVRYGIQYRIRENPAACEYPERTHRNAHCQDARK